MIIFVKLKRWYAQLKIRNKFFVIVVVLLGITSWIMMLTIHISYLIYDETIVDQSSQILNCYTDQIETELKKVEKITYDILADESNQNYFQKIQSHEHDYVLYQSKEEFSKRFLSISNSENYIYSIGILYEDKREYSIGRYVKYLDEERKTEVLKRAKESGGGICWIPPSDNDSCIIAARQIRSVKDMKPLVTLIIRIDLEKLNRPKSINSAYKSSLVILDGRTIILDKNEMIKKYGLPMKEDVMQRIMHIKKEKNIVTYNTSGYTNWTYINILPYKNIFNKITRMKNTIGAILMLLFCCMLYGGYRMAESITKPITSLNKKMQLAEQGDFSIGTEKKAADVDDQDEISQLEYEFNIMINKIHDLIEENYVKQLAIKESQFKVLQSQINPHFLYNTLASINGIAKINKQEQIVKMVKALSKLLRNSISNKKDLITIREEVELLNSYIYIQQVRFGERLHVRVEIEEAIMPYLLLKLSLQPIVENAINYSMENITCPCVINVTGRGRKECIEICIEDNGPGVEENLMEKLESGMIKAKGNGIGLLNIQQRIKLIYKGNGSISVENREDKGTRVVLNIPYRLE